MHISNWKSLLIGYCIGSLFTAFLYNIVPWIQEYFRNKKEKRIRKKTGLHLDNTEYPSTIKNRSNRNFKLFSTISVGTGLCILITFIFLYQSDYNIKIERNSDNKNQNLNENKIQQISSIPTKQNIDEPTYEYEIELISGGLIKTDNLKLTTNSISYKSKNGITESVNKDQIKSFKRTITDN